MRCAVPTTRLKFGINTVIDCFSYVTLFLFSTHDCIVRLWPILPYTMFGLVSLTVLIFLSVLSKRRMNQRMYIFLLFVYLIVAFSILLGSNSQSEYIISLFLDISTTSKLWVYLIVFSLIRDEKKWRKILLYFSYINMILLIITTMSGLYSGSGREVNYLGIGITGAMWIPVIMQNAFTSVGKRRIINAIATVFFSAFVLTYGNRGSVVAIFVYLVFCILHFTKLKRKIIISIGISAIVGFYIIFQNTINTLLLNIIYKLGISSRNLTLLLNNQITYTTHRMDEIWVYVFDSIKERWWIGYGLCYDRVLSGDISTYAHNLVLETWLSFGVIIGTVLLFVYVVSGLKLCLCKNEPGWSGLFSPFFISSTVLLMFNNSFCQLGFFWASTGMYFAYQKEKRRRLIYQIGGYKE